MARLSDGSSQDARILVRHYIFELTWIGESEGSGEDQNVFERTFTSPTHTLAPLKHVRHVRAGPVKSLRIACSHEQQKNGVMRREQRASVDSLRQDRGKCSGEPRTDESVQT